MISSENENKTSIREIKILRRQKTSFNDPFVHLLPCRVDCDSVSGGAGEGCGPAKVNAYFAPVIRDTNEKVGVSTAKDNNEMSQVYKATFRGRRLKGIKVNVPDGSVGCILKEPNQSHSEEVREFEVRGEFKEFNYWSLQSAPTADDKLLQAMTWNKLAHSLHAPLPVGQTNTTASVDS